VTGTSRLRRDIGLVSGRYGGSQPAIHAAGQPELMLPKYKCGVDSISRRSEPRRAETGSRLSVASPMKQIWEQVRSLRKDIPRLVSRAAFWPHGAGPLAAHSITWYRETTCQGIPS